MTIQVTGKNIDAGEAYKTYISNKISTVLEKYIGPEISGHVRLEKERGRFKTDCSIRLRTGLMLESHGDGGDAYASADAAVEHLEKRVRRYKRRLKGHHNSRNGAQSVGESVAPYYVIRVDEDIETDTEGADNPIIIAEEERGIRDLTVSEAVMQLDLTDRPLLLFRNAAHGGLNVVYRRADGHVGWIDPKPEATAGINGAGEPAKSR